MTKYKFNELSIELTHKCSLNCIYCSSRGCINRETYLEIKKIKEIIAETKNKYGIRIITLSGGESLLHPGFWDLFDFISKNDLDVILYTSGVLLGDNNKRIPISKGILRKMKNKQKGLKMLMNIQGHDKNLIEKINRVKGSYELIQKSINNIISEDIYLGAHIVPFKYNFTFLKNIVEFCEERSFDEVNFLRFVPQGRGSDRGLYNTVSEFAEIIVEIRKILQNYRHSGRNLKIRIGHPINFLFLKGNGHLYDREENHYCRGGLDAPLILPTGEVSMCPAWKDLLKFSAGNIYEKKFSEIWESEYFKIFREFIIKGYKNLDEPCRSCKYLEECRGKCVVQRLLAQNVENSSSLENLIYYAPDPQCFKEK